MKTYALTEKSMHLLEAVECFDYLVDTFGESINEHLNNFFNVQIGNNELVISKQALAIAKIFNDEYKITRSSSDIKSLVIDHSKLKNSHIDIELAISRDLLIEVNYIQLTSDEKKVAIYAIDGYMKNCGPSMVNNLVLESILAKLKNA